MQTNIVGTLFMLLYLCLMLVIGWYSSNRIKSNADFVVAGRSLGPWILAATLAATEIGGGRSLGGEQQGMEGYGIRSAWYVVAVGV
ncbi:MAG: sodium:solute symporter family protein, partial [Candidatus Pelethousia sp.]|nr:sodium:solute symporter family protein [Candidatus Pelethousia sp.]